MRCGAIGLVGFLKAFAVKLVVGCGTGQALAWLFGYQEEVNIFLAENRILISAILLIYAVI
ncbi:MAG: hypothetical protein CME85_03525 [Henriciella sp.]|nr:hypothetical protein [Henriciella sp.]